MSKSSFGAPTSAHKTITSQIIALIEAGAPDFVMPWHVPRSIGRPANALTAKPYRGINVVALWAESLRRGYGSGVWATYRQWSEAGAQVRRGSHGTPIVFYKPATNRTEPSATDDDEPQTPSRRLVMQTSIVFNQGQVDGWACPEPVPVSVDPHARADALVRSTEAKVVHGGHVAAYDRRQDQILMPPADAFRGTPTSTASEAYYATLLHELVHWTGAPSRLDRAFGQFGDETYAFEELIAELGAAFLCADLDVANVPRPDHAAYIAGWLKALQHDARALFRAAALADLAVAFVSSSPA